MVSSLRSFTLALSLIMVPRKLGALLVTFYVVAWHSGETLAIRALGSVLTLCIVVCSADLILSMPLFSVIIVSRTEGTMGEIIDEVGLRSRLDKVRLVLL